MGRAPDADAQVAAVRQGIGVTRLPCFVGDADPLPTRAPGIEPRLNGALWILTQGEARNTKRVRLFIEFMSLRLAGHAPLLRDCPRRTTDARPADLAMPQA